MGAESQDKYEKNTDVRISLHADSGYTAEVEGRISAEQWGGICAIVHGTNAHPAPAATSAGTVAQEGEVLAKALANAARLKNEMPHLIQPSQGDKDLALLGDYIATLRAQLEEREAELSGVRTELQRHAIQLGESASAERHGAALAEIDTLREKLAASEARVGALTEAADNARQLLDADMPDAALDILLAALSQPSQPAAQEPTT